MSFVGDLIMFQVSDVVRPTPDWGPGDKQARKMYLANKAASDKSKGETKSLFFYS